MERARRRLEKTAVPDPNTHPYRSHSNLHTIPAKLRRYLSTTCLHRGITRFIRNLPTVSSNKSKTVGSSWPRGSHWKTRRGRFLARMHEREEIQHRDTDSIPADTRDVKGKKKLIAGPSFHFTAFHVRTDINRETKNRNTVTITFTPKLSWINHASGFDWIVTIFVRRTNEISSDLNEESQYMATITLTSKLSCDFAQLCDKRSYRWWIVIIRQASEILVWTWFVAYNCSREVKDAWKKGTNTRWRLHLLLDQSLSWLWSNRNDINSSSKWNFYWFQLDG